MGDSLLFPSKASQEPAKNLLINGVSIPVAEVFPVECGLLVKNNYRVNQLYFFFFLWQGRVFGYMDNAYLHCPPRHRYTE